MGRQKTPDRSALSGRILGRIWPDGRQTFTLEKNYAYNICLSKRVYFAFNESDHLHRIETLKKRPLHQQSANLHPAGCQWPVLLTLIWLAGCQQKTDQSATHPPAGSTQKTAQPATSPVGDDSRSANDFLIVPGQRAGIVRGNSTEANLFGQLGKAIVTPHDSIFDAEGNVTIGTTLFKGTPDQAHILWKDTTHFARPDVVLFQPQTDETGVLSADQVHWTTPAGVRYGKTLKEVERINGRPFTLYGFEWDYGGYATNWGGGKLRAPGGKDLFLAQFSYWMQRPGQTLPAALEKAAGQVVGDSEFKSSHPAMQQINPRVFAMQLAFD